MPYLPELPKEWQHFLTQGTRNQLKQVHVQFEGLSFQGDLKKPQLSWSFYPQASDIFNAFNLTSPQSVRVVILGQDPYHGPDQAHGLAFSVREHLPLPPSLRNIFKELSSDLNIPFSNHSQSGDLSHWARQGVFLLNSVLTVIPGRPASHRKLGWQEFTDGVIYELSRKKKSLVFILWGDYAQKKAKLIDESHHLILTSTHPSPLSAYRGFFGSRPFSKANDYLLTKGLNPIKWI